MRLPDNQVGISDIKQFLDCPRRFTFGMRRHLEGKEPPEDQHPDTLYGTAAHDMFEEVESLDLNDDEALQATFNRHAPNLDPTYFEKLKEDLQSYHERDHPDMDVVAVEREIRVPLFKWSCPECDGEADSCSECDGTGEVMIYFRAKIDRLFQSKTNLSYFLHKDYKTSKHKTSKQEVDEDPQMWAYNWAICEFWPECEELEQEYDQLRFGIEMTSKTDAQREHIREWIERQIKAILETKEPEPTLNQWCPWCPIKESCSEIDRLSEFESARIKFLSEGMPEVSEDPEMEFLPTYIEKLPKVQQAVKLLKAYEKKVKDVIKDLPEDRRESLGWDLKQKKATVWTPEALQSIQDLLGPEFYRLISLSQEKIKSHLKGDDRLDSILEMAQKRPGSKVLTHRGE